MACFGDFINVLMVVFFSHVLLLMGRDVKLVFRNFSIHLSVFLRVVNNLAKYSSCFGLNVFIVKQLARKPSMISEKRKEYAQQGAFFFLPIS